MMRKKLIQLSAFLFLLMTTMTVTAQVTVNESDVQLLPSISSTGAQAFNTHYTHKANTRVELDCEVTQDHQSNWEALFGGRFINYNSNAFCFFSRHWNHVSSPQDNPCYNRTGQETNGTGFVYGERIKLVCEGQTAKWYRYSDLNTVAGSVTTTGTADNGKTPMLLFNLNTSSTEGGVQIDTSPSVMKLYGCQIYEGSTLKCDFVPAKYNNVIGLYDRVNHTFDGSITDTPFETDEVELDYELALTAIEDGQSYRIFTMYNGQKYYVTAGGYLSTSVDDAPFFDFTKVAGEEYAYGFMINNNGTYFSNPKEINEAALTLGHLNTTNRSDPRNTWEAQVFFLNTEGKYAIRSTNAASSEDPTKWGWIGRAFWTVNTGANGPLAEYSFDMNYIWELEIDDSAPYPVWIGSKRVTSGNMNNILGDGKVRYTPGEGKGTLTFTTSTPTINGVHSWSAAFDGETYNYAAKIYAEGIDLTINAPSDLTLSGTGEDYGIYVANEGALTINGNFSMTAGGSALCLDNGDLSINGNFYCRTSESGILVRKGDVRVTGDVDIKNTSTLTLSVALNDGYVYFGPGNWEIESGRDVIHAEKKDAPNGGGGIVLPFTHELYNPVNPMLEPKLSDDKRGFWVMDGNGGWTFAKHVIIRKKENWVDPSNTIVLDTLTCDCVVPDNTRLTGTLQGFYKVSIADGATVSLRDVNINIDPSSYDDEWEANYRWAGITCEGNANIYIERENTVKGFCNDYPGIYVPEGKTLLIYGSGSLNAISGGNPNDETYDLSGAGIGGGKNMSCGNIIINEGTITATGGVCNAGIGSGNAYDQTITCGDITINGGTVTATGEYGGAGIGSGMGYEGLSTCGDITITGGSVTATGGHQGAGIGSGMGYEGLSTCGDITINGGIVTATGSEQSAGIGSGLAYSKNSTCGDITINGGIVTATGGKYGAGIGSGRSFEDEAACGNITISGGEVTATGGSYAAGIGTGVYSSCGDIHITDGIEKVVAITDYNYVGYGYGGTCGTITLGDNLGIDEKQLDDKYYSCTIQAAEKIKYPVWVGDTQVTFKNKDDVLGNGWVSYTPGIASGTLTFNWSEPTINKLHNNAVISAEDINLTINTPEDGLALNSSSYGIWIDGDKDLTINGNINIVSENTGINAVNSKVIVNGKLTIYTSMNGVWLVDGDLIVNGDVELNVSYLGIYANNVSIKGNVSAVTYGSNFIQANGDVTIDGNMNAESYDSKASAVKSEGNITVVSGYLSLFGENAAMNAKGTIIIPNTYRITTPSKGQVKQINGRTYIVDESNNIAKQVEIEMIDCDVNDDGAITIADVTALVNIILGKDTSGQYNHDAADVNGDNLITIADVTALVNIILGK